MCLVTFQQKPKRTFLPMTVYKVLETTATTNAFRSTLYPCIWIEKHTEKTKLGITLNEQWNNCSFANAYCMNYYRGKEGLTQVAEGFHAYLNKEDAAQHWSDAYGGKDRAVVVEMRIPAFSLILTDECDLIVSNKMKFIRVVPEMDFEFETEMPY